MVSVLSFPLPDGLAEDDLRMLVSPEMWKRDPQQAAILALRRSGRFDEAAYLARYPDVQESGMDAIEHYLRHGQHEKRKVAWISPELLEREECSVANACFLAGEYRRALALYEQLSHESGMSSVEERMTLCREKVQQQQPLFSVIIPARNAERTIERALQSVLSQTVRDIEILVCDDASSDSTVDIVVRLQKAYPHIRLYQAKVHAGPGKARNEGLSHATGIYVTFLDADDYFADDAYLAFLAQTAQDSHADIVMTPYIRKGESEQRDSIEEGMFTGREGASLFLQRKFGTHGACGKLFRADVLRHLSFGEYGYSEDVLFVCKACFQAGRIVSAARHGYVYDNTEASSWRPERLTEWHFYSSIRLLLEVFHAYLHYDADDEDMRSFVRIWQQEHGARIHAFLSEQGKSEVVRQIRAFLGDAAFVVADALADTESRACLLEPVAELGDAAFPLDWLHQLQSLVSAIQNELARMAQKPASGKQTIVIYTSSLHGGGLEKVAALVSKALARKYSIVFLLDKPENISYDYCGTVLGTSLTDRNVLLALRAASFVLDFHYKDIQQEFPLCAFCIQNFSDKYIATIHNTDSCHYYFEKIHQYLDGRGMAALHSIVCVSHASKKSLVQRYGSASNIHVIPNPIDWDTITQVEPLKEQAPFILFAGRLYATEHKGLDLLINAYLKSGISRRCKLVLAGNGSLDKSLQEIVRKHAKDIQCIGFTKTIYAYMKQAAFVVIPSRWEGFSMTLAESLACGTPVLMTRVGVAEEVITHRENGYLVLPDDEQALVEGLKYMCSHAEEMCSACAASVAHYSVQACGSLFERLLMGKREIAVSEREPQGHTTYTVVSACYNVAPYLHDFFQSLVSQTLSFQKHIRCIMVDDGSTDETAAIIRQWQQRFPDNILYLHKENGGQASARNLGLNYVTTPWVTFTDPDDFLDADYFRTVDDFLARTDKPVCMIGSHLIFYHEATQEYRDTHPLNFKFRERETVLPVEAMGRNIQLHVASSVLNTELLKRFGTTFDERVRPNFEDGNFILNFICSCQNMYYAIFLSDARYCYRKRQDMSSTLDTSWSDKRLFDDVFTYGCLPVLCRNQNEGGLSNVVYSVLYHIIWFIKAIVNNPEKISFLTEQEKDRFLSHMDNCMSYIDADTINSFNLAGAWFYHKVGIMHCFKKQPIPWQQIVYIEEYDACKDEIRIRYFTDAIGLEEFQIDGQDCIPTHVKTQRDDFLGRTFVLQRHIWLPLEQRQGVLRICLNGQQARITCNRKQHATLELASIRAAFAGTSQSRVQTLTAPWIFIDREIQADDNAEHLYRWVRRHHPYRDIYFVLRRDSHDWDRLAREGFRLLAYGSPEHEEKLLACSKIISSHIDKFVINYFGGTTTDDKQILWLQHGVTKDDLSRWLNPKKRIDLFVTTSPREYASIVADGTRYRYTDKEVRLTGFPRHDALLSSAPCQRQILVMPTWRHYIMGQQIAGNIREKNPDFMQTTYARCWKDFLCSPELEALAQQHGYTVRFFPHSNIQPYLDDFELPSHIQIVHHADGSIQQVFRDTALMLTDYSSVAFEMAFLQKPVLYYQFDEREMFSGTHTYQKGYFDYRKDGFGPVVTALPELLAELEHLLAQECRPQESYLSRMQETFPFRDGKNCERVYQAILDVDAPHPAGFVNTGILRDFARMAFSQGAWSLAGRRLERLSAGDASPELQEMSALCAVHELLQQGRLGEAAGRAASLPQQAGSDCQTARLLAAVFLLLLWEEFGQALALLARQDATNDLRILAALCAARCAQPFPFALDAASPLDDLLHSFLEHDWAAVEEKRGALPAAAAESSLPLALLLCEAAQHGKCWQSETKFRNAVRDVHGHVHVWARLSAARIAAENETLSPESAGEIVQYLDTAFPAGVADMPPGVLNLYCDALMTDRQWSQLQTALTALPEERQKRPEMVQARLACAEAHAHWQEAAALRATLLQGGQSDDWLGYAHCLKNAGRFEEAYAVLKEHEQASLDYWQMRCKLALVLGEQADAQQGLHICACLEKSLVS